LDIVDVDERIGRGKAARGFRAPIRDDELVE
jgi:hypothetical protein